jgi:formate dehydrogenase gamma subunit
MLAAALVLLAPLAVAAPSSDDCLSCHSDVDPKAWAASVHGGFSCTDCHADVTDVPHDPAPVRPDCGTCHSDAVDAWKRSIHAKGLAANQKGAQCADCHGGPHAMVAASQPASPLHRTRLPDTCGKCHGVKFVMEPSGIGDRPFFSYRESVHGKAVAAGSLEAAVCTDCHRSHDILTQLEADSSIFKANTPKTCGRCHGQEEKEYSASVHGKAVSRGQLAAPVCTDCHGIHGIKARIDPSSTVSAQNVARFTCAQCHDSMRLTSEFALAGQRSATYLDSYHGLAGKMGSKGVANCASCHGVHNIFPSSDPRSTVNKANLARTCGTCHPGASENFAQGAVHMAEPMSSDIGTVGTWWVRRIYIWMIVVVIGGMLLHNFLAWRRAAVHVRAHQHRPVVRMTPRQQLQHGTLAITFLVLVWTGFALKYPDSWLAWTLGGSEELRRWTHRIAALVMLAACAYHVVYAAATKEGRRLILDFLPTLQDVRDVTTNLKYLVGLSDRRPRFGRFGYPEKAEYLALVWGTIVMAVTGFMAWFSVAVTSFLPRWAVDIAIAVHYYEAILASLAILVWHLYFVIFDPEIYPMNWAWYDGRVSAKWYAHEHPEHYAQLVASGEVEAPAPSPRAAVATGSAPPATEG